MKNYKTIIAVLIIAICALVFNYVKAIQITPDEMQSLMGGNLGAIVFNSSQVGKTPANGEILQTDGSSSTWVATSTLGIAAYAAWGAITGTLSSQADLQAELDAKLANSDYYASTTPEHITSLPSSSYIALTDLSATNPITYNNGTGAIGINTADTSTTGALTSTDWNTFNNKLSSVALTDLTLAENSVYRGNASNNPEATSDLTILSSGNVGIGTTAPVAKLDVRGNIIAETDSYTKLLLHMDGTDDAQVFVDSSEFNHTVTAAGNAKTENTEKKFGVTSGYFDGLNTTYLTSAYSNDWDLSTGNFTIDMWVYPTADSAYQGFIGNADHPNLSGWIFGLDSSSRLVLFCNRTSILVTSTAAVSTNEWTHVAIVRTGTGVNQTLFL